MFRARNRHETHARGIAEDRAREAEPRRRTLRRKVIEPAPLSKPGHALRDELRRRARELTAPVGRAVLIVDDAKLVALAREALDCRQEIPARGRIDPARTKD